MTETVILETAKAVLEACERKAAEIGTPMVIAVANSEGTLVAQHRMDGAWLGSIDVSWNRAFTATAFDMPTHELTELSQPGNALYGLQNTNEGRIVIFGGGYPLERGEDVVGAVGVSGGAVEQDRTVAEAGVEAFGDLFS
jgi:uncharacterized protein GlcG (DUF336 family)